MTIRSISHKALCLGILIVVSLSPLAIAPAQASFIFFRSPMFRTFNIVFFPFRFVYYVAPYYYYVPDYTNSLQSQVDSLKTQLQSSQADRDKMVAEAQQLSAKIDSLNQHVNDLKNQMSSADAQYQRQLSDARNTNQMLQSNIQLLQSSLDAARAQNNMLMVGLAILGVAVVFLFFSRRTGVQPVAHGKYAASVMRNESKIDEGQADTEGVTRRKARTRKQSTYANDSPHES